MKKVRWCTHVFCPYHLELDALEMTIDDALLHFRKSPIECFCYIVDITILNFKKCT